jgi:hypothetical protein
MAPFCGKTTLAISLSNVLLPLPFDPSMKMRVPRFTCKRSISRKLSWLSLEKHGSDMPMARLGTGGLTSLFYRLLNGEHHQFEVQSGSSSLNQHALFKSKKVYQGDRFGVKFPPSTADCDDPVDVSWSVSNLFNIYCRSAVNAK